MMQSQGDGGWVVCFVTFLRACNDGGARILKLDADIQPTVCMRPTPSVILYLSHLQTIKSTACL